MLYTQILNKNKNFLNLYKKGNSIVCKYAAIYVKNNRKPFNRLGITAGKKIGNAVHRNRAKRIIRQVYREFEDKLPIGIDIVIVARPAVCQIKSTVLSEWFEKKGLFQIQSAVCGGRKNEISAHNNN